jgi:hypothetical protein|eukprot:CAMPEP_0181185266 /NCGR_PEP_ID=MMETSP1096-20121128/9414_1 /TAXON_ID=156174 ORGANISM="Chrysochromulina ericina, Strain CCMP281" /NCGR_SAMPLE_ID=MMETSP1096 /ASSEMBLY_ACC=CAM_ASM_000453 /LENGTH=64 /DNA_ID=CAMNT_0023274095 /DNA_START=627 /DNA_END=818 /DNA_ORIENTATION=+
MGADFGAREYLEHGLAQLSSGQPVGLLVLERRGDQMAIECVRVSLPGAGAPLPLIVRMWRAVMM